MHRRQDIDLLPGSSSAAICSLGRPYLYIVVAYLLRTYCAQLDRNRVMRCSTRYKAKGESLAPRASVMMTQRCSMDKHLTELCPSRLKL